MSARQPDPATLKRNEAMLTMREAGEPVAVIAERYGLKEKTVTSALASARRHRNGEPPRGARPPTDYAARNRRMLADYVAGVTADQLAERHGLSEHGVRHALRCARLEAGAQTRLSPEGQAERDARIFKLHGEGKQQTEIARTLGVTTGVVAGVLHRAGVTTPGRARKALRSLASNQARSASLKARGAADESGRIDGGMRFGEPGPAPSTCQYFTGPTEKGDAAKCGAPVDRRPDGTRRPYCAKHARVCYRPSSAQGGSSLPGGFRL